MSEVIKAKCNCKGCSFYKKQNEFKSLTHCCHTRYVKYANKEFRRLEKQRAVANKQSKNTKQLLALADEQIKIKDDLLEAYRNETDQLKVKRDELFQALEETLKCLIKANLEGQIVDTLWLTGLCTLFDFIASTLGIFELQDYVEDVEKALGAKNV